MFALLLAQLLAGIGMASAQVLAVMSDASAGYRGVVDELRAGLAGQRDGKLRIDDVTAARLADVDAPTWSHYELVVTVGLAAAQAAVPRQAGALGGPPILSLLIPRQGFEKLASGSPALREHRLSAVFIDQPLSRQVALLRLALPDRKRVGALLGPSSRELADALSGEARSSGLDVSFATVGDRAALYPALQELIPHSDLLLLLPDPVAVNADTVYGLLLTTYRAGIPVVGFSEGLLNAGALLSMFSTAQQQGRQGADIARRLLAREGTLPEPQYPNAFSVRINASVARSLGLHLPTEQELHDTLSVHRDSAEARHGGPP